MTDRELIDLAAKAADLGFVPSDGGVGLIGGVLHAPWNPLHDDADAFRLAVKLRLELGVSDEGDVFSAQCRRVLSFADADVDHGDEYALMRLAITRAAAEIGKAM
jgi:hypothetical protein